MPSVFCIIKISNYFLKVPHSKQKRGKQRGPACFREFCVPSLRNDPEKPDITWPCASAPPHMEPAIRAGLIGQSSCSRRALPTSKSISNFPAGLACFKTTTRASTLHSTSLQNTFVSAITLHSSMSSKQLTCSNALFHAF